MRAPASYAVATLTAALALACAGPGVATRSEAPARAAEPSTAAAASTRPPAPVQRFHAPLDPPPRFLDPDRRARIESAFPAVEDYLAGTVARDHLVGLAAGIVIDGELAWFHAWGHSDPARGLPIELDTRFGVGSISKTITAMAILKLRDEGRLQLDRPARVYLPELAQILYPSVDSPEITIRHLLTHSSGLPRMGAFPEYPASPPSRAEFLATLRGLGLERAPGLRRVYSNLGVQLLGPLVDNVAGVDHRTYTRDAILRPIGMAGAAWLPEHIPPDKLAVGHEFGPDRQPRARPHWRPGAADAAGGLYASVEDLARYAAYNLDAWPPRDGPERGPLRRATIREAHRLQVVSSMHFEPDGRGAASVWVGGTGHVFGVFSTCHHEYVVGHNGKTLNYRATLYMLPWQGVAVILLTNQSAISSRVLPSDGLKVLDLLGDTGALAPRRHAPAPALVAAAGELGALVGRWDPAAHARVFSDDYRDAYPVSGTEREFARWRELVGACQDPQPVDIDEPRAGELELPVSAGACASRCGSRPGRARR
ncbi:MAG: beta-lactamase family protein [Myxococcales bacterium]|nr:beta-lactamase family protein [Myxococcales bacterium]